MSKTFKSLSTPILLIIFLSHSIKPDCFCGDNAPASPLPPLSSLLHPLSHISQAIENTITHFNKLKLKDPHSKAVLFASKAENVSFQRLGAFFRVTAIFSLNQLFHFQLAIETQVTEKNKQNYRLFFAEIPQWQKFGGPNSKILKAERELSFGTPGFEIEVCRFVYIGLSALVQKSASFKLERQLVRYEPFDRNRPKECVHLPVSFSDFFHRDSLAFEIQQIIEASKNEKLRGLKENLEFEEFGNSADLKKKAYVSENLVDVRDLDYISLLEDENDLREEIEKLQEQYDQLTTDEDNKRRDIIELQSKLLADLNQKLANVRNGMQEILKNRQSDLLGKTEGEKMKNGDSPSKNLPPVQNPISELLIKSKTLTIERPTITKSRFSKSEYDNDFSFVTLFGDFEKDEYELSKDQDELIEVLKLASSIISTDRATKKFSTEKSSLNFENIKSQTGKIIIEENENFGKQPEENFDIENPLKKILESESEALKDAKTQNDPFDDKLAKLSQSLEAVKKPIDEKGNLLFARSAEAEFEPKFAERLLREESQFDLEKKLGIFENSVEDEKDEISQLNKIDARIQNKINSSSQINFAAKLDLNSHQPCEKLKNRPMLFVYDSVNSRTRSKNIRLRRLTRFSQLAKKAKKAKKDKINDLKIKVIYDSEIESEALKTAKSGFSATKSINFFSEHIAFSEKKRQEVEDWIINLGEILSEQGLDEKSAPRLVIYSDYSIFVQFPGLGKSESMQKLRRLLQSEVEREIQVEVVFEKGVELHYLRVGNEQILLRKIEHGVQGQEEIEAEIKRMLQ